MGIFCVHEYNVSADHCICCHNELKEKKLIKIKKTVGLAQAGTSIPGRVKRSLANCDLDQ